MKKLIAIVLILMLATPNVNAGWFSYAQASSAEHKAREAKVAIKQTQTEIKDLREEVKELKEKVDMLMQLMEKQVKAEDSSSEDS